MTIDAVTELLNGVPFPINNEIATQNAIEALFINKGVSFLREESLDRNSRPDFLIGPVVVEVKIKGDRKAIIKQCLRYLQFDSVTGIILISSKTVANFADLIPPGKQLRIVNISKAWL